MKKYLVVICAACVFWQMGCGEQTRPSEDYGLKSLADLNLNENNHSHGYGQRECFVCHNPSNIHNVNHLGAPSFDLAKDLVSIHGLASCSGCHGSNGVSP